MQNSASIERFLEELKKSGRADYEKNCPLSGLSSFKIGGPAAFAVFPADVTTLAGIVRTVKQAGERVLVFGNASNVLFCDEGLDAVVVFTGRMKNVFVDEDGVICAEAGVGLTALSQFAQKSGFAGLEYICGIPGNVGGGVYMNAGAYEHNLSENLCGCEYLDVNTFEVIDSNLSELEFGYRYSSFQNTGNVVLRAKFKAEPTDDPDAVRDLMNDHLRARSEKQPLDYPSAGSVFKRYPGFYTSKLIDEAGLKGASVGGAQVSEKHAGFIINRGNATARDVMTLVKLIQDRIFALHGIHIECELRYIV